MNEIFYNMFGVSYLFKFFYVVFIFGFVYYFRNNMNLSLSRALGISILVALSWYLVFILEKLFNIHLVIGYIVLYVLYIIIQDIIISLIPILQRLCLYKKFNLSLLTLIPIISLFDAVYGMKCVKIINVLRSEKNISSLQKYFDDKDKVVQWFVLELVYQTNERDLVEKWFEEKYTRTNTPVPPTLETLYEIITKPNV